MPRQARLDAPGTLHHVIIHLNPLRTNLVDNLSKLDRYNYCGHSVILGRVKNDWQDRDYVLKWFGSKAGEAKRAYQPIRSDKKGAVFCP